MIEALELRKRFPDREALATLSLQVEEGEVVALLGANGAGKTTLLRVLAGRLTPDGGRAMVAGHDVVRGRRALAGVVGAVLSSADAWFLRLDPLENLTVFGVAQGMRRRAARDAGQAGLEAAGLDEHARRAVGTFSRGMRARLAVVRATLHDPAVLLLDEPSAGLDLASQAHLLRQLQDGRGERTVVIATHDLAEAVALADRAVVLADGVVRAVLESPKDEAAVAAAVRDAA